MMRHSVGPSSHCGSSDIGQPASVLLHDELVTIGGVFVLARRRRLGPQTESSIK
jgi:hypothetical protein